MRFAWEQNLHLEDKSKRTHTTKDFPYPTDPTKRIKIQSSGLLHYHDGESFKDLQDLPFPEGNELIISTDRHFMMDLPEWGKEELIDNNKVLRIYDKKNVPIYIFRKPFVISKGNKPYRVVKITDGMPIRDTNDRKERIGIDEVMIRRTDLIDECQFEIENHKLYVKVPSQLKNSAYPLQVYDDTDTSSTNNGDAKLINYAPNTNYSSETNINVYRDVAAGDIHRAVIKWLLSSGSGTISDVKLYLKAGGGVNSPANIDIHELTQTFVEAQVTWNSRSTGNAWTNPGGDYDAAIIDTVTDTIIADTWYNWVLMGTGATNPLTLNWGETLDVLLKFNSETGTPYWNAYFWSKEHGTSANRPYIEITYTPLTQKSVSDSGVGSETIDIKRKVNLVESGSGAETIGLKAQVGINDSGQGQDVTSLLAKTLITDQGNGVDLAQILAKLLLQDFGSGVDAIQKIDRILVQDSGIGADVVVVKYAPFIQDSGLGADLIVAIKAKLTLQESGLGIDAIGILSKILLQDSGIGQDIAQMLGIVNITEQGVGSDIIAIILAKLLIQDSGAGTDQIFSSKCVDIVDSGAGADLFNILPKVLIQEAGIGVDRIKVPSFYSAKYPQQGDSYSAKYPQQGDSYSAKYPQQNTQYQNKYL